MIYLTEGLRIFLSSCKNRFHAKRYKGNAEQICRQVVKDCWNGRFFQTSTANFPQFWTRDFGWCTQSLLKLKHEKEVHQTLRYALNRFQKHNKMTTAITPRGRPFDFPRPAVDSLPWLIHSILVSQFPYHSYRNFLNREIQKLFNQAINPQTGLVRPELSFSSMKDYSVRRSSCYDNCMIALLAKDLQKLKLTNPFQEHDYPELIRRHFWNGKFFYDDLSKQDYVAGDANLFPILFGLITNKEMLQSILNSIRESGLDVPFPLKYTAGRDKINFIWEEFFMRNYESDSSWMHLGPLFVKAVQHLDSGLAEEYKEKYRELIEKHQNFLEVFDAKGRPYQNWAYYSSPGMLWAANYLTL